ncbi:MAG: hypothetical protein AAGL49_14310, partial [Pseudomonadota bacterium]
QRQKPGTSVVRAGHWEWTWRSEDMGGDFCSKEGADALRRRIEEFWSKRGYNVDVQLINQGFVPAMRSARTDIRSDMVNGMPSHNRSRAEA